MKLNFWGILVIVLVILAALGKISGWWLLVPFWPLVIIGIFIASIAIFFVVVIIVVIIAAIFGAVFN